MNSIITNILNKYDKNIKILDISNKKIKDYDFCFIFVSQLKPPQYEQPI